MAEIEVFEGVAALPREMWNELVGDASPFLEWEWLASLEESGAVGEATGWVPRPLVVRDGERLVAACPLYLKMHSEGEFVFDHGWADAAHRAGIRYYPKLLAGVPFTPVAGRRFLVAEGEDRALWTRRLAVALRELCDTNQLSGVHVNFCREEDLAEVEPAGFLTRVGIQYHWHNHGYRDFEDYLERFRSKRRNQIRRERRSLHEQGVEIEVFTGDAVTPSLKDAAYRFYRATVDERPWGRAYLPPELFDLLWERFRHRLCLVFARRDKRWIGGTVNVQKGDALYGRYWGATEYVPHLHFNVCYYAAIEHCLDRGLARFEPGAGGDYKQMRGFDAQPTWSLHYLAEPRLAQAVERFLEAERDDARQTIDWLRDHSALKPR